MELREVLQEKQAQAKASLKGYQAQEIESRNQVCRHQGFVEALALVISLLEEDYTEEDIDADTEAVED